MSELNVETPGLQKRLLLFLQVEETEFSRLSWSFFYFLTLLASYYMLQPLRDELGISGGIEDLPALFIASLFVMLVLNPVFSGMVSRWPREFFIPLVYHFFVVNLLIFFGLLEWTTGPTRNEVAQAFFVWVSVFNLFAVSVFWGFMADLFNTGQGKRLFGLIGAGGTIGELMGSFLTVQLSPLIGSTRLLLISALLLEASVVAVKQLTSGEKPLRSDSRKTEIEPSSLANPPERAPSSGGSGFSRGIRSVLASRYLLGICLFMFLYTFTSSFLYFEKASLVKGAFSSSDERTAFFGKMNFLVGLFTLVTQTLLTGRIVQGLGLGLTLALVPCLTGFGFVVLALHPALLVLAVFEVSRKSGNYAVSRPAREILYTVLPREEKYQAKSFIDTFVYRAGDALAAGAFKVLLWFGLGLSALAWAGVPFALLWVAISLWLGKENQRKWPSPG